MSSETRPPCAKPATGSSGGGSGVGCNLNRSSSNCARTFSGENIEGAVGMATEVVGALDWMN
jgi:hypothetical protein